MAEDGNGEEKKYEEGVKKLGEGILKAFEEGKEKEKKAKTELEKATEKLKTTKILLSEIITDIYGLDSVIERLLKLSEHADERDKEDFERILEDIKEIEKVEYTKSRTRKLIFYENLNRLMEGLVELLQSHILTLNNKDKVMERFSEKIKKILGFIKTGSKKLKKTEDAVNKRLEKALVELIEYINDKKKEMNLKINELGLHKKNRDEVKGLIESIKQYKAVKKEINELKRKVVKSFEINTSYTKYFRRNSKRLSNYEEYLEKREKRYERKKRNLTRLINRLRRRLPVYHISSTRISRSIQFTAWNYLYRPRLPSVNASLSFSKILGKYMRANANLEVISLQFNNALRGLVRQSFSLARSLVVYENIEIGEDVEKEIEKIITQIGYMKNSLNRKYFGSSQNILKDLDNNINNLIKKNQEVKKSANSYYKAIEVREKHSLKLLDKLKEKERYVYEMVGQASESVGKITTNLLKQEAEIRGEHFKHRISAYRNRVGRVNPNSLKGAEKHLGGMELPDKPEYKESVLIKWPIMWPFRIIRGIFRTIIMSNPKEKISREGFKRGKGKGGP